MQEGADAPDMKMSAVLLNFISALRIFRERKS
jgi:hypothetical protein